jgi:hypothetical protein
MKQRMWLWSSMIVVASGGAARAETPIRDNSFFVEEAYNQEPGVVQHISTMEAREDGGWQYGFTQEWPLGAQAHQLSFGLPLAHQDGRTGFGDLSVNYRWQVLGVTGGALALAPRVTLILPTGGDAPGAMAALGGQINLPLSLELGRSFVAHTNLGGTLVAPDDAVMDGGARWNLTAGQSVIWLLGDRFNLLAEATWTHAHDDAGTTDELVLSPGVRVAVDLPGGAQIVPGFAAPVHIDPSTGTAEADLYVYLSFEHSLASP